MINIFTATNLRFMAIWWMLWAIQIGNGGGFLICAIGATVFAAASFWGLTDD